MMGVLCAGIGRYAAAGMQATRHGVVDCGRMLVFAGGLAYAELRDYRCLNLTLENRGWFVPSNRIGSGMFSLFMLYSGTQPSVLPSLATAFAMHTPSARSYSANHFSPPILDPESGRAAFEIDGYQIHANASQIGRVKACRTANVDIERSHLLSPYAAVGEVRTTAIFVVTKYSNRWRGRLLRLARIHASKKTSPRFLRRAQPRARLLDKVGNCGAKQ